MQENKKTCTRPTGETVCRASRQRRHNATRLKFRTAGAHAPSSCGCTVFAEGTDGNTSMSARARRHRSNGEFSRAADQLHVHLLRRSSTQAPKAVVMAAEAYTPLWIVYRSMPRDNSKVSVIGQSEISATLPAGSYIIPSFTERASRYRCQRASAAVSRFKIWATNRAWVVIPP